MRCIADSISLVILGQWNPAVIQPRWVAREILKREIGAATPVLMEFADIPGIHPRFRIDDVRYVPAYDRLTINPLSSAPDRLRKVEAQAISMLESLPHTPVTAFGLNLEFADDAPTPAMTQIFDLHDPLPGLVNVALDARSTHVTRSFSIENHILNVTHGLDASSGAFSLSFNFHYPASTATAAAEQLPGSFLAARALVVDFLVGLDALPDDFGQQPE